MLEKEFGKVVLSHAVQDVETFTTILECGEVSLPSSILGVSKRTPYMEQVLGFEDVVFLSGGFDYCQWHHDLPYAFLFDKELLFEDQVTAYNAYLVSQGWMRFVRVLRDSDKSWLERVKAESERARRAIQVFEEKDVLEWWKIEEELHAVFAAYPAKSEVTSDMVLFKDSVSMCAEDAVSYLEESYFLSPNEKKFEVVSHEPVLLSEYLVSVYVHPSRFEDVKSVLERYGVVDVFVSDALGRMKKKRRSE